MDIKKMKVLCYADHARFPGLLPNQSGKGGLPMSAWQITAAKQRLGSEQVLLTRAFTEGRSVDGVRILPLSPWNYFSSPSKLESAQPAYIRTVFPPDLFSLGPKQIPCRLLANYFGKVIRSEKPSVIHIHQPRRSNMPMIRVAMLSGVPVAVTLHGLGLADKELPGWRQSENDRIFDKKMIEYLNSMGVAITCVGEVIREKILNFLEIKYPENIFATRNGVDNNVFHLEQQETIRATRKRLGVPDEALIISSVGSLDRRKNHEFLLRSIHSLLKTSDRDIYCWIIGGGHLKSSLADLTNRLGLNKFVTFLGAKADRETAEILAASNIMALVSFSEGFSRTVLESISVGTPTVSFKDLFSTNFADSAGEGLVIADRGGPEEFAKVLRSSLEKQWDRRKVAEVAKNYGWDDVGRDYLNILEEVVAMQKKETKYRPPQMAECNYDHDDLK